MRASSVRVDRAAVNVANVSTPGFKRQLQSSDQASGDFATTLARLRVDMNSGKLVETKRPLDLAINGSGFFQLRAGDQMVYSRQGNFALASDGRVITPQGYTLQQAGGGDLVLDTDTVTIASDGTVLDGDKPLGQIAIYDARDAANATAIDGSLFMLADDDAEAVANPSLRQGAVEASNVSLGDEMISMMGALRGAETGAKLVQVYDDLMGKAITTFGQVGR
jgi:flagellar basal-body rod protein FlgG